MMRAITLIIAAVVLGLSQASYADDLLVIAHPSVVTSNLSSDELAAIYLLKTTTWQGGGNIVPVNREAASSSRTLFSDSVLRHPPSALNAYWNQMHFKGKVPPLVQESDQAVLAFVQKVPGAIGYISATVTPANVKVLAKVP
jgi:ABC-type phosphate transport system substrate-binding protein